MPEVFIEKDYWVTELLRSISAPVQGAFVVFKGGTSLSKAARIIQRFSEDVDVLLVMEAVDAGKGTTDRILKEISSRAARDLGLAEERETSGKGVHRTTNYAYQALYPPGPIASAVKLEMGTRGGEDPWRERDLRSYIAEASPGMSAEDFDEMAPATVRVLAPERTLLEKLSLLHSLAARYPETANDLIKAGRHLYDVDRLLADQDVLASLAATNVPELCEAIRQVSIREFDDGTARPEGGFAESPVFDPDAPCAADVREAYAGIDGLLLAPKRPLIDVCERVRSNAGLL